MDNPCQFIFSAVCVLLRFVFSSCFEDSTKHERKSLQNVGEFCSQTVINRKGAPIGRFTLTSCSGENCNILDFPSLSVSVTMVTRTNRRVKLPRQQKRAWRNIHPTPKPSLWRMHGQCRQCVKL